MSVVKNSLMATFTIGRRVIDHEGMSMQRLKGKRQEKRLLDYQRLDLLPIIKIGGGILLTLDAIFQFLARPLGYKSFYWKLLKIWLEKSV